MRISVVIPTFNRERLLPAAITALANQTLSAGVTYEVIFVNNGSTDGTDALLEDACRRFPQTIRGIHIPPTGGPSAPRNVGIRAAEGDAIVILDDDVLPASDLVLKYAEFHQQYPEQHHAAIGELYVPESLLEDPMSLFHSFPYDELRGLDHLTYLHFWTCNVSVKRQFMLVKGMFDEGFLYYEDILCGHRLAGAGMHLHFWPSARGQHLHQMTAAGLAAKARFLGRWTHPFLERIPDPAAKQRLGVLSTDLPMSAFLRRLAGRGVFRLLDNPLTVGVLESMGVQQSKRSRITDYYYGLIFRRNLLAGYYESKRHAEAGRPLNLTQVHSPLADRGDI
jgi:glycosyltransferase involved in cell wall biosynthesis